MRLRQLLVGTAITAATVVGLAGPAFAHECFNPKKPAGAGVNYTIIGFENNEPIFQQTGPGNGIGGFATLDGTDVHTGGLVGGPGSHKPQHACDDKGIDYIEACAG
jgi:hypothetical protein